MKRILDMSCQLLNVYTKIQIDISKHVEKSPENMDGREDGRTDKVDDTKPTNRTYSGTNYKLLIDSDYILCLLKQHG